MKESDMKTKCQHEKEESETLLKKISRFLHIERPNHCSDFT